MAPVRFWNGWYPAEKVLFPVVVLSFIVAIWLIILAIVVEGEFVQADEGRLVDDLEPAFIVIRNCFIAGGVTLFLVQTLPMGALLVKNIAGTHVLVSVNIAFSIIGTLILLVVAIIPAFFVVFIAAGCDAVEDECCSCPSVNDGYCGCTSTSTSTDYYYTGGNCYYYQDEFDYYCGDFRVQLEQGVVLLYIGAILMFVTSILDCVVLCTVRKEAQPTTTIVVTNTPGVVVAPGTPYPPGAVMYAPGPAPTGYTGAPPPGYTGAPPGYTGAPPPGYTGAPPPDYTAPPGYTAPPPTGYTDAPPS